VKSKVLGILLIFCFVAPLATTYIILKYQKKQVKREVKWKMIIGIDKEELVLLKFTEEEKQTQLNWNDSKEFEYKGEMYDIVETKIVGDTIYYWCWLDNEETELNKKIDDIVFYVLGHDKQRKESQKRIENLYKSLYFNPLPNWNYFVIQSDRTTIPYKYSYKSISYPPLVPPPEIS